MLAPLTALAAMVQAIALAAPSTTTLSLSTAQSAYGQSVTATAAVATVPGPAQGDVVFSVDGLAFSANLGATGTATVVLPDAAAGQHAVSATFVPQLPTSQQASTSPTQAWVVTQVRTRLQVRVIGKGARIPTSVQVKAAGEYGSLPTGRVKVVVNRVGTVGRTRVVRSLGSTAVAVAGLGRLPKGDYRLVVTYAGDTQHLRERHVERFHVHRR
jgi:hypothetical protein